MFHVHFVGPDPVEIDLRAVDSDVPAARVRVEPGEVLEVSKEIAEGTGIYGGLLDQPAKWQRVTPTKKSAAKPGDNKED